MNPYTAQIIRWWCHRTLEFIALSMIIFGGYAAIEFINILQP